jgi:hypothetical protein
MVGLNMAGLLGEGFDDPRSAAVMALAGGLLQGNMGGGLLAANAAYGNSRADAMKQRYAEAQMAEIESQRQMQLAKAQQAQAELARQQRIQQGIPGLFRQPGMTGGEAVPQTMGGVPMFSQPSGVAPMQQSPGGFDVQQAIRLGMHPDEITKYAGLANIGRPEVARVEETMVNGRPVKRQFDKYGSPVGEALDQWKAPVMQDLGGSVGAIDPVTLQPRGSFPKSMTFADRNAAGQLGVARDRLAFDKAGGADAGKPPAGYRWTADRSGQEAIPGGPADLKAGAEGQKKVGDAKDVLMLLNEVDDLLPKSTGSWPGAGVDFIAANAFGSSTKGAEAAAQLKVLQGALVAKQPKMSGPQSDKDVQLYREMAGQIGDPTIPVAQRQAAADTVRKLNEKYAGVEEGSSKPSRQSSGKVGNAKPDYVYRDGKLVKAN